METQGTTIIVGHLPSKDSSGLSTRTVSGRGYYLVNSLYSNMNSVAVSSISSFRGTDVESWITSDGRAYLVQLVESDESDSTASSHWGRTQADESVRSFC
jgi:hypothetical protein